MERRARHIREFVEALAGPAVYLVFFGLIYVAASLVCALSGGNDPIVSEPAAVIGGAILGLTAAALLLLVAIAYEASQRLERHAVDREDTFMALLTLALAALSALAVIWTALPAAVVTAVC